jgi:hypothetical protein
MQITLDIPDGYLIPQTSSQLAQTLKLYAALFLFQTGQLSRGAACEFAGTNLGTFLEVCKQYQIPVLNDSGSENSSSQMECWLTATAGDKQLEQARQEAAAGLWIEVNELDDLLT